ncbi:hypothetical protein ACHAXS_006604 [Conticribra weissflogii]
MESVYTDASGAKTTPTHVNTMDLTLTIVNIDLSVSEISNEIKTPFTSSLGASDSPRLPVEEIAKIVLSQCQCTDAWKAQHQHQEEAACHAWREKLTTSITRYLREPDRWTAFASILLKSVAFHRTLLPTAKIHEKDKVADKISKKRPIVDLPRTKFNRPYIPMIYHLHGTSQKESTGSSREGEGENENIHAKFNISHQYPYIALVQHNPWNVPSFMLDLQTQRREKSCSENEQLLLGLDLVTFQCKLNDYIPTIHDYLLSFEGSFTRWEWERINYHRSTKSNMENASRNHSIIQTKNTTTSMSVADRFKLFSFAVKQKSIPNNPMKLRSDNSKLKEFYLRWAMKEAYTKALGVGMNMEFDSFETLLVGIDDETVVGEEYENGSSHDDMEGKSKDGIWNAIRENATYKNDGKSMKRNLSSCQFSVIGGITKRNHSTAEPKPHLVSDSTNSSSNQSKCTELWEFIFIPLNDSIGCVCICRGPLEQDDNYVSEKKSSDLKIERSGENIKRDEVVLEQLSLWDLVKFHWPDFDFNFFR